MCLECSDKTINSVDGEKSGRKNKEAAVDKDENANGGLIMAPSFNMLDKNCPAAPQQEDPPKKVIPAKVGLKFGQGQKKKTPVIAVNNPSPPVSQQIGTFVSSTSLNQKPKMPEPKEEKKGKHLNIYIYIQL